MENGGTIDELRQELLSYIKRKFYTRQNILEMADDIVNQAFLDVAKSLEFSDDKYNFGYMSVACLRVAYRVFHRNDRDIARHVNLDATAPLIDEEHFVQEIEQEEDCTYIFESLLVLRQIEQTIIKERYYGNFSFREISERSGIKLNTVLSHHRRALEKLRPVLTKYFDMPEPWYQYGLGKKTERMLSQ